MAEWRRVKTDKYSYRSLNPQRILFLLDSPLAILSTRVISPSFSLCLSSYYTSSSNVLVGWVTRLIDGIYSRAK
jgi:hypothetical protein